MKAPLRPTTLDAIVEAAFDLFSRDPSASLADVAEKAGVGRATLHRHFTGRADLIRTLALTAIAEMDKAASAASDGAPSASDAFRRILTALIPLGDRYGFLARELVDDDRDIDAAYARQMDEIRALIDAAKGEGLFDPTVPTAWIAQAFDHLLYAAWESVRAGDATHAQAADLAWRTLTVGLKRDAR